MSVEHISEPACETWSLDTASGLTLCVPPSMRSLTTYVLLEQERWFEPEMSLLPHLLQPGMNALDIGANHGVYALEIARCTRSGHVWAFEPTVAPRTNLLRSVQINGMDDRITVVDAGLADAAGHASFAVHDNSELNSRHGLGPQREHVRLETLDRYLDTHAAGVTISFVKLGAGGDELQVLAGGRRFFSTQSPVVLFELKHGAAMNTALIERWQALGYGMFRWSAELKLLLPFDAAADETTLALNLLAVRPAQQQELAERGLLVSAAELQAVAEPTPDPHALETWCTLSGQSLAELKLPISAADLAYLRALNAVASAHLQAGLRPAERVALMVSARATLLPTLDSDEAVGPEAWTLIVHGLFALGQQHAAVRMAAQLLSRWPPGQALSLPFVPPLLTDLERPRTSTPDSWLRQVLGEFVALRSSHSSYFAPPTPERWAQLLKHCDHGVDIERRYMLSHMIQDRVAALDGLCRLPAEEATCNPSLWMGLMQATRAMLRDDLAAPRACAGPVGVDAVLAGLPVAMLNIIDISASGMDPENEPYAALLQAGRGCVTGYVPDARTLHHLQQQHPNTHTHRFVAAILGDGRPAVFHETEWAPTASLLEPNRRLLDRYQQLGAMVRERARHPVGTVRLDDLLAAGEMDVLKLDAHGAQGLIFDGAPRRLDECLVVWSEVEFVPLYRDQPVFGDIDARLRRHGLQFMCFAGISQRALASWPQSRAMSPQRQQQLWADAIFVPGPERIEQLNAPAAARLALLAHHMLSAQDLCHAALLRHDRVAGTDFAVRYQAALTTV
jgi:FkbM family methyltransferase